MILTEGIGRAAVGGRAVRWLAFTRRHVRSD